LPVLFSGAWRLAAAGQVSLGFVAIAKDVSSACKFKSFPPSFGKHFKYRITG